MGENRRTACCGCGAMLEAEEGPTHAYMLSSPACWRLYGEILAAEYGAPPLMAVHRLSVDAYAVQHPGDGSRRAIQSVGLHLARLMIQLERPELVSSAERANDVMLAFAARKSALRELAAPKTFEMTVADVAPAAGTERHADAVRAWAESAWRDWRDHHDYIRQWAKAPDIGFG